MPERLVIVEKAQPQAEWILPSPLRPAITEVGVIPQKGGPGPASSSSGGPVAEAVGHAHGVVPTRTGELSAQNFNLEAPSTLLQHNQAMKLGSEEQNVANRMETLDSGMRSTLQMGAVAATIVVVMVVHFWGLFVTVMAQSVNAS